MDKQSIDAYLERYWAGESTLEEEQALRSYYASGNVAPEHKEAEALFSFFNAEREVQTESSVGKLIQLPTQTKTKSIQRFNWTSIAASVMIVFTMLVGWNYFSNQTTIPDTAALEEIEDPEEAYRVTMEALAYLSNKYDKGAKPLNSIKKVNATNIIK